MRSSGLRSSLVVSIALGALVIGATVSLGAALGPNLNGAAQADEPAQRGARQEIVKPRPCPLTPGLYRDGFDDFALELVFHRFDGNVDDDVRVTLPNIFYGTETSARMTIDCRVAILSVPATGRVFQVDPVRRTVSEVSVAAEPNQDIRPLNDG